MSTGVRVRKVLVLACGLALLWPTPVVQAGPGDGSGQGGGGSQDGTIIAQVTYSSTGEIGGGGDGCAWEKLNSIGIPDLGSGEWPVERNGVIYNLWRRTCDGLSTLFEVPETRPSDLLPQLINDLKSRRLPDPAPAFPMLDLEFGWAYVKTPVDFRVEGSSWQPVSVTAAIGPVWATVSAEPRSLTFDPGDGSGRVSCAGDGPVAGYDAAVPGVCSYTYVNASSTSRYDGYHFLTEFSMEWSISWTSSTGQGGPLASYSTTSTAELAVAEVKGIVTCTGGSPEQGGC